MNLYDFIQKRKACRTYDGKPLAKDELVQIETALAGFKLLYPGQKINWRFTDQVKGMFRVEAPHYLVITGQDEKGEQENAGFFFQQFVLWLSSQEIGSVWLGGPKDASANRSKNDLVTIGFGRSIESIYREKSEFKRMPIEKITNYPEDPRIQAVHLAPSGLNLQPWYFRKDGERTLLYKKKLNPAVSLMYKLTEIDLGIALCHYALASEYLEQPFSFKRSNEKGDKKGYVLFGELL